MNKDVEAALGSATPFETLAGVVRAWKADGVTQAEAEKRLMRWLSDADAQLTGAQGDAVRDVLDLVVGFCSPSARIY